VEGECPICARPLGSDKVWNRNHIKSCSRRAQGEPLPVEVGDKSGEESQITLSNGAKVVRERGQGKAKAKATQRHQQGWLSAKSIGCEAPPYSASDKYVLRRASSRRLNDSTVSGFTDEVYRTYQSRRDSEDVLKAGSDAQAAISEHRKIHPRKMLPGWRLIYEDTSSKADQVFKISRLRVNGQALTARPDLVFARPDGSEALIVEVKVFRGFAVPDGGWPNLRAQLWAYSWIDDLQHFSRIRLVGEIWRRSQLSSLGSETPAIIPFDRGDLDSIWSKVFVEMGGEIRRPVRSQVSSPTDP
jgi:hypothetical protein